MCPIILCELFRGHNGVRRVTTVPKTRWPQVGPQQDGPQPREARFRQNLLFRLWNRAMTRINACNYINSDKWSDSWTHSNNTRLCCAWLPTIPPSLGNLFTCSASASSQLKTVQYYRQTVPSFLLFLSFLPLFPLPSLLALLASFDDPTRCSTRPVFL